MIGNKKKFRTYPLSHVQFTGLLFTIASGFYSPGASICFAISFAVFDYVFSVCDEETKEDEEESGP